MTERKGRTHRIDELETVVEAGRILMESGAEIYRIEETMTHMAAALQIERFSAYVINRGIFASGINHKGIQESKIISTPDYQVHLGRIEAVNALSRELDAKKGSMTVEELFSRLQEIRKEIIPPLWKTLLVYFISIFFLSIAIGSAWPNALASALSVLVMGLVVNLIEKHIRSSVLLTIIKCIAITVSANILYQLGIGSQRGIIILGAFILLVPGALYTNAIREFSENNYSTGMSLLLTSVVICFSMAVGALLGTELLPFADQMTEYIPAITSSPTFILVRAAAAGIGTTAFAFLYHSPRRYYPDQGMMGAVSWLLCMIMDTLFHTSVLSIFIAAFTASILSRFLAVRRKCPRTVFLSISIFPLLPGLSLFWSIYLLMTGSTPNALISMRSCFISAFAIALAISSVQQIPERFFTRLAGKEHKAT